MKQSAALLLAASTGTLAVNLKPIVDYPSGLSGPFDPGFWSSTTAPSFTSTQWTSGLAPEACVSAASGGNCISGGLEVYTVTYSDCTTPWTFCRCNNAQMTVNSMIDLFGRMPVGLRSTVRHPIAVNKPDGSCSAYASIIGTVGDIVMQGACYAPSVWIHESSHQMDFHGDLSIWGWHDSPQFQAALAADTCAADDYGNGDLTEEFAQIGVVSLYKVLKGVLPTEAHPGCLNNQVNATITKFGASRLTPGGTCFGRAPDSSTVSAVWFKGRAMARSEDTKATVLYTDYSDRNLWTPPEYAAEAKL